MTKSIFKIEKKGGQSGDSSMNGGEAYWIPAWEAFWFPENEENIRIDKIKRIDQIKR